MVLFRVWSPAAGVEGRRGDEREGVGERGQGCLERLSARQDECDITQSALLVSIIVQVGEDYLARVKGACGGGVGDGLVAGLGMGLER